MFKANFGITFPMTEKINVIGNNSHPFYKWAKEDFGIGAIPKWNFHKIVIGKNGKVVDTFASCKIFFICSSFCIRVHTERRIILDMTVSRCVTRCC